jgi:HAD superfamily hydrolase (TIGR01509 family)
MDGTLVDNIPFHREAWMSFLDKHNIELNPEDFLARDRGNIDDMIRSFFGQDLAEERVRELGQGRERIYRDLYRGKIKEMEGLTVLLQNLGERNMLASLATMSSQPSIDLVIDELNIRRFFHSITNGLEIRRGKPDPEIYELALRKLMLTNKECLVIEDSIGGITSASKAGIDVIGITTSHPEIELLDNGCYAIISDFTELILA